MNTIVVAHQGTDYRLVVAARWHERMRGLSGTTRIDWPGVDGLLLQMPWPMRWPIWMRGMRMPIRLLWLRRGAVVGEIAYVAADHRGCLWPPCVVDAVAELFIDY